ncbi:short-chain dehydrogenase/reductase SDR [Pandoraea horticolens]|uniref:Short-chain dehydrogenase/reductase SDR n=1 Tax=Pandoraea horticolens TaxID=2508298 RepID=A0A5E4YVH7_9BURK|nr:short-chain dehydrogenase/reductase SDR [Pandoraea horticolens]
MASLGPNARAVKGSVSDEADLDRLYAAVKAERGTLDIVFANAGTGSPLPLGQITATHIDETFDTNVKGTIFTVQKALPLMGEGGSIILTGSSAGTTGAPAFCAYSAIQRMADPAEIAAAAAFLASPDSSFMTASEVAVDGGLAQL